MNKSRSVELRRLLKESSLLSSSESIDPVLLKAMLERHYGLSGHVERLGVEKGDTFKLTTGLDDYLVKVSPSDEPGPVTGLQTAVVRYLEDAAPALPVQRIKPTVDGSDSVLIDMSDGTHRTLSVFCFIEGCYGNRYTGTRSS